jgi:ABC-type microcin C transport system permease subunit YejB
MNRRYLLRKLATLLVTLYATVTFNFLLFHVLPGSPVQLMARAGHSWSSSLGSTTRCRSSI